MVQLLNGKTPMGQGSEAELEKTHRHGSGEGVKAKLALPHESFKNRDGFTKLSLINLTIYLHVAGCSVCSIFILVRRMLEGYIDLQNQIHGQVASSERK